MKRSASAQAGFTLIELLVVIAIVGILMGVGISKYQDLIVRRRIDQQTKEVVAFLRQVKKQADSGEKPTHCGSNSLDGYLVENYPTTRGLKAQALCPGPKGTLTLSAGSPAKVKVDLSNPITFYTLSRGASSSETVVVKSTDGSVSYQVTIDSGGNINE